MSWHIVKLGEIAEFSNGINFDKNSYKLNSEKHILNE